MKFKNFLKNCKKNLTYVYKYDIIYTGGEEVARQNKKKPINEKLENALIDFLIGLLLLIIDKIIK